MELPTLGHLLEHADDVLTGIATGGMTAMIASAAVRALPEPPPMGSMFYRWFYDFTHLVFANLDKCGFTKKT